MTGDRSTKSLLRITGGFGFGTENSLKVCNAMIGQGERPEEADCGEPVACTVAVIRGVGPKPGTSARMGQSSCAGNEL
jgi:hypothetical protein